MNLESFAEIKCFDSDKLPGAERLLVTACPSFAKGFSTRRAGELVDS